MMELLTFPFMQHAIMAAVLCSIACGIMGSLVVLNRLSFLAGAVSHAAYGGIGLSFMFGWPALPATLGFSLTASLLMAGATVGQNGIRKDESTDAAIGILWAAGMAFGIILIELTPGYAGDLSGYLFGSILAVPARNLWFMLWLDLILAALFLIFRQGFVAITLDPDFAAARGLPVRNLFFLLVAMTSVAVVMLLQAVGLILVIALLTIPPQMARRFSRSLVGMMCISSLLCLAFCLAGLALSFYCDISSGASIIGILTVAYAGQSARAAIISRRS